MSARDQMKRRMSCGRSDEEDDDDDADALLTYYKVAKGGVQLYEMYQVYGNMRMRSVCTIIAIIIMMMLMTRLYLIWVSYDDPDL